MHLPKSILAAAVLATAATAQFQIIVPAIVGAGEGASSTAYPWGRGTTGTHVQYIYDSSNFTGVTGPMTITQLRWRANGTTVLNAGGTWAAASIDLSTAAVDQAAATPTFASNHGPDRAQVYTGAITALATGGTTPNTWYVDVPLTTPFTYDPANGDLLVDLVVDGAGFAGVTPTAVDCATTNSLTSRVYNLTSITATTGTFQANVGLTMEVNYVQNGLFAAFASDVTGGGSPLTVNFTDQSFSSAPGGVTSWAWDFDGDSVVDSTVQNPTHVYTACGSYNVSLTVNDGTHPPSTQTRTAYIVTDVVTPSFTSQSLGGGVFQFTDTSTPTPTSWAWDLNGDNVVDSTLQNPTFAYGAGCIATTITLNVTRLCQGPFTTSAPLALAPVSLTTTAAGGNGITSATWMGMFLDIQVTNPSGINVCGISARPYNFAGSFDLAMYVKDGTYVGSHANAAAWRLVATGSAVSAGGTSTTSVVTFVPLASTVYLAPGDYGVAIYVSNPLGTPSMGQAYTNGPLGPFSNGDLTIVPNPTTAPGRSSSTLFGTGGNDSRVFNGAFHYSTATNGGDAGYGFFGPGCAGSLGVTNLVATSRPQLGGTVNVTLNNLPLSAAIMVTGFSNTTSGFGPLPLDLTPFGAPGCFGRVSADATQFLAGTGNAATWSLSIPNIASLLGVVFYNQALVLDGSANSLGAVISDAAAGMVGS